MNQDLLPKHPRHRGIRKQLPRPTHCFNMTSISDGAFRRVTQSLRIGPQPRLRTPAVQGHRNRAKIRAKNTRQTRPRCFSHARPSRRQKPRRRSDDHANSARPSTLGTRIPATWAKALDHKGPLWLEFRLRSVSRRREPPPRSPRQSLSSRVGSQPRARASRIAHS